MTTTAEHTRLQEDHEKKRFWKRWGPYLSERSWGTVREDYSPNGDAWGFLPHDLARSKAFRWGEDGLAGYSDRYQLLCFSLALWNGKDPILKERAFGLVPAEGNHGEDVKEYYFYLDSSPSHSYMKYLYKYPQAAYPYQELIDENRRRNGQGPEFELIDTGVFNEHRYFDVFVEFAKSSPDDTVIKITAHNRGPERAPLHIIPQLFFRNVWSWGPEEIREPRIKLIKNDVAGITIQADDEGTNLLPSLIHEYRLGSFFLHAPAGGTPLFTNNETNRERLYNQPNNTPYVKDAFHRTIVNGEACTNPGNIGTKSAILYSFDIPAGGSETVLLRLGQEASHESLESGERVVVERLADTDEFYRSVHPAKASEDEKLIQRQALAGMLWSKQFYCFDVERWMDGDDPSAAPPPERMRIRNTHWRHLNSMRILSMPDKWEYPWFAAWDLAFHALTLALVDFEFAKEQLSLMLFEQFQHPNGQIPAYEWEFSDLNPPVHAWAVWRVFHLERIKTGRRDRAFLEQSFHKLMLNFTWWVNKVDSEGNNVFEGGFLGLDNITVLDRSQKLPEGAKLEQADATGWMGAFSLVMMRIALELAKEDPVYERLATKFFQHYAYIGAAIKNMGGHKHLSLWCEENGFFHDKLRYPDGSTQTLAVRSLVGIIPLYAVERLELNWLENFPEFRKRLEWALKNRHEFLRNSCHPVQHLDGRSLVCAIFDESQLNRLLERIFDSNEFLSEFGVRSLSKFHEKHPFRFGDSEVRYEPAETSSKLKGGNSNWRGPIWFPTTFLIIESLKKLSKAYGPEYCAMERPDRCLTFDGLAGEIAERLISIFTRDENGRRAVFGDNEIFQNDPHWRDYIPFYEYFNGDTGAGLGASHQTGWTGLVATLIDEWRS